MTRSIILSLILAACLGAGQEPTSKQTVRVQVVFTEQTECGVYRDAIYLTVDDPKLTVEEFLAEKQAEIDKAKATRIAAFVDRIKHPPAPVEPTKEQLEAELAAVVQQQVSLEAVKVSLTTAIAAKVAKEAEGKGK